MGSLLRMQKKPGARSTGRREIGFESISRFWCTALVVECFEVFAVGSDPYKLVGGLAVLEDDDGWDR